MIDKVIFLDVDGVLNTSQSQFEGDQMLYSKLKNLGSVLLATGAKIIVSSSWRFGGIGTNSDFSRIMKRVCNHHSDHITAQLILSRTVGATSISRYDMEDEDGNIVVASTREQEILDCVEDRQISKWVAVDDEGSFFPSNPSWLVLCDPSTGLDDQKAAEMLAKLQ